MSSPYYELIIEGPFILTKGFVEGFLAAKGRPGRVVFNRECDIRTESVADRIMKWLSTRERSAHVILHEADAREIEAALAGGEAVVGLKVISKRLVKRAWFAFRFKGYTPAHGAMLKELFASPPEGVTVEDYREEEHVADDAKGPEGYAPLHHYTIEGSGRIAGEFEQVFWMRRKLVEQSLVEQDDIELELEGENAGT